MMNVLPPLQTNPGRVSLGACLLATEMVRVLAYHAVAIQRCARRCSTPTGVLSSFIVAHVGQEVFRLQLGQRSSISLVPHTAPAQSGAGPAAGQHDRGRAQ